MRARVGFEPVEDPFVSQLQHRLAVVLAALGDGELDQLAALAEPAMQRLGRRPGPGLRNQPGSLPPDQGIRTGSKRGRNKLAALAQAPSISR